MRFVPSECSTGDRAGMRPGAGERGPESSEVASAGQWANRLERGPWRWLFTQRMAVVVVIVVAIGFVALLGLYEWRRYVQAHGGEPLLECHSTQPPARGYDVRWQWMPPGLVCEYSDGERRYVGL